MNERGGKASLLARGKATLEQLRKPVRIMNEKRFHSHAYQIIQCESQRAAFESIGMSGFGSSSVNGRKRVPRPAAKTNA